MGLKKKGILESSSTLFSRIFPFDQRERCKHNGRKPTGKFRVDRRKKVAGRPMIGPAGLVVSPFGLGFFSRA
jgi:hypothetical protein